MAHYAWWKDMNIMLGDIFYYLEIERLYQLKKKKTGHLPETEKKSIISTCVLQSVGRNGRRGRVAFRVDPHFQLPTGRG